MRRKKSVQNISEMFGQNSTLYSNLCSKAHAVHNEFFIITNGNYTLLKLQCLRSCKKNILLMAVPLRGGGGVKGFPLKKIGGFFFFFF